MGQLEDEKAEAAFEEYIHQQESGSKNKLIAEMVSVLEELSLLIDEFGPNEFQSTRLKLKSVLIRAKGER